MTIGDASNRSQGLLQAAGRERLIHGVDLDGRELDRAEQDGRVGRERSRRPERTDGVAHPLQPDVEPEPDGGKIVRVHQRIVQEHRAVGAAIVISRSPRPARAVDPYRIVAHDGCEVELRLRQRREIHRRLDHRPHRPNRIQGTIEARPARVTPAHHREHFTGPGVGDRDRGLELLGRDAAPAHENRYRLRNRRLRRALNGRVEGREDPQPLAAQHAARVVAPELSAHQIHERRKSGRRRRRTAGHPEWLAPCACGRFGTRDAACLEPIDHPVPPLLRALGMASRVVVRRPSHEPHEQRHLVEVEVRERSPEVEVGGTPESVDGMSALLAEKDLVQISLQQLALGVAPFEQHRDERLVQLAGQCAFGGEKEVPGELLGQRAATLHGAPRAQVRPGRANDSHGIDSEVPIEPAILDLHQNGQERRRDVVETQQHAIFAMGGVDPGDLRRIETHPGARFAVDLDGRDPPAGDGDCDASRGLGSVGEPELAGHETHAFPVALEARGSKRGTHAPVAGEHELRLDRVRRQRRSRRELQGTGEYPGGHGPARALELVPDPEIQPGDVGRERDHARETDRGDDARQCAAALRSPATSGRRPCSPSSGGGRFEVASRHGAMTG